MWKSAHDTGRRFWVAAAILASFALMSAASAQQTSSPSAGTFQKEEQKDVGTALQDLSKKLGKGPQILNGQAQITLLNNTPPAWKVTIVAGGVKFFYSDNSDYTDGPRSLGLGAGGSATFISNDASKCVKQFFLAMTVVAEGQAPANMTFQDGVGPGECLLHETVVLGPKSAVSEKDLRDPSLYSRLVLTHQR
jgi:hypothetical protein